MNIHKPKILFFGKDIKLHEEVLSLLGTTYSVTTAELSREVIASDVANKADLFLLDDPPNLALRSQYLELLKGAKEFTPIIIFTSRRAGARMDADLAVSVEDVIFKPLSKDDLIVSVNRAIALSKIKREAELSIKISSEKFHSVFEQAAVGIAIADLNGMLLEVNKKCTELLGYTAEELGRKTFLDLTHPDDRETTQTEVRKLISGECSEYSLEKRYIKKDGSIVWSHTHAAILTEGFGAPMKLVGILQDITARKEAEAALHKSENALREESTLLELLNRTGAAISSKLELNELVQLVTDAATEIGAAEFGAFFYNSINEEGEEIVIYSLSGAPIEAFSSFGHPRATELFGSTFRGESIIRLDDVLKDPRFEKPPPHFGMTNRTLPVRSYLAVPVISRTGTVIGGLLFGHSQPGVFTERSEKLLVGIASQAAIAIDNARLYESRQKAENELRIQQVRLQSIIDHSEDAIVTKSLEGIIQSWNPAAERIFGYAAEEAIGQPIITLIPEELRFEEDVILSKISAGQRVEHFETERLKKNGERIFISVTVSPIKNSEGKIIGATKIARDITITKRQQRALQDSEARYKALAEERRHLLAVESSSRKQVEEANRIKDQFLATLSHELRTPLNAILGWTQLATKNLSDVGRVSESFRIIERNARSQAQIIEDLLDMNRIISGTLKLDLRKVEFLSLLDEAIETVTPAITAKNIELRKDYLDKHLTVVGDPNRLKQVAWNLLTNAAKFTGKGGHITVTAGRKGSNLFFSVTDTGEGITGDFLPFVFDRFSQSDTSASRRYGGLGLGLSIVRYLVELHGGHISANSDGPGKGAAFTVSLPIASFVPWAAEPKLQSMHEHEGAHELSFRGLNALVVDDEADARNLIKALLEDRGAKVTTAATAQEALNRLYEANFDLLLSDIGMPGEDGYVLIKKVRSLKGGRNIPAIALTAYARSEDRVQALNAGFQMHVPKPVEPSELVAVIKSVWRQEDLLTPGA